MIGLIFFSGGGKGYFINLVRVSIFGVSNVLTRQWTSSMKEQAMRKRQVLWSAHPQGIYP
jgi:hypothetical protein